MSLIPLFVSCSRGVEPLLVTELTALGAVEAREGRGGVRCQATLETAYRACLWSRLASRVLMPLADFPFTGTGEAPRPRMASGGAPRRASVWGVVDEDDEGAAPTEAGGDENDAAAETPAVAAINDAQAIYEAGRRIVWPGCSPATAASRSKSPAARRASPTRISPASSSRMRSSTAFVPPASTGRASISKTPTSACTCTWVRAVARSVSISPATACTAAAIARAASKRR